MVEVEVEVGDELFSFRLLFFDNVPASSVMDDSTPMDSISLLYISIGWLSKRCITDVRE
jgi:hypothetical protein